MLIAPSKIMNLYLIRNSELNVSELKYRVGAGFTRTYNAPKNKRMRRNSTHPFSHPNIAIVSVPIAIRDKPKADFLVSLSPNTK